MREGMEKLTGRAAAAALAFMLAGAAEAAPFRMVSDGPESVWVLDEGSGALNWCRPRAASGPKVIDVFGFGGEAREAAPRSGEPACTLAPGTMSPEARTLAAAGTSVHGMLGRMVWGPVPGLWDAGWSARLRFGYGAAQGYGAAGGYGMTGSGGGVINIFGPEDVDIYVD
jgi:hypothetical protein